MNASQDLARLHDERIQVIQISERIAADLSALRTAQSLAQSPGEIASLANDHRKALASLCRAQKRLREINITIKRTNLQLQEEIRIAAKRAKAARRNKGEVRK